MSIKEWDNTYSQLQQGQIRLIDLLPGKPSDIIQCVLRPVSLENKPKYVAVSYTWGPSTTLSRTIFINTKPRRIRPNLYELIRVVRDVRIVRSLWIDSLCIDQWNMTEKSLQVRLMGRIYSSAQNVLLYLGLAKDASDAFFDFLETAVQSTVAVAAGSMRSNDTVKMAINALCQRDYWSRAWIRQELILAKEIEVYCGNRMAKWDDFVGICTTHFWEFISTSPAHHLLKHRRRNTRYESQNLFELLVKYGQAQCYDPRDRVYSLLSLASDCADGKGIQADYSLGTAALFEKVMSFCRPSDPVEFIGILCDVAYPWSPSPGRFLSMHTLATIIASVNNQVRVGAFVIPGLYGSEDGYDAVAEYEALKTRFVWQVVVVFCPTKPTLFTSIYQGRSKIDRMLKTESTRALKLLSIQEDFSALAKGPNDGLAWLYTLLDMQKAVVRIRKVNKATEERIAEYNKLARSSVESWFWQSLLRIEPCLDQDSLFKLASRLNETLELEELGRPDVFHQGFSERYYTYLTSSVNSEEL